MHFQILVDTGNFDVKRLTKKNLKGTSIWYYRFVLPNKSACVPVFNISKVSSVLLCSHISNRLYVTFPQSSPVTAECVRLETG